MRKVVGLIALLALAGCRSTLQPDMQACTLIGCSDGITVVVQNAPAAPYTVEVVVPGGATRSMRCEVASGCGSGVFVEGVSAAQVTVRIVAAAGTSSHNVQPAYTESRPNGANCPPLCRQARVEVRYAP